MPTTTVAIVGAGLSGLYAAFLLEQAGFTKDYQVLEARSRTGGRIASLAPEGFDLGPTWFWPGMQPGLDQLVHDLGLARFAQHDTGDLVFEHAGGVQRVRMPAYEGGPTSMRLAGGMGALAAALQRRLDPARTTTGQTVRRIRLAGETLELDSEDTAGHATTWHARHVLLALPPRLAAERIAVSPALPPPLQQSWQATPTWMAPHAKYLAVYRSPFWREQGLSGQARSARGPLAEIHDASMPGGRAALFGFLGLPARLRQSVADDVLRTHCRAQLARLFGPQALAPEADALQDWAADPMTASAADADAPGGHGSAPPHAPASGPWQGRITGIASEWSPDFPGYLAGAIDAAQRGVQALLRQPTLTTPGNRA